MSERVPVWKPLPRSVSHMFFRIRHRLAHRVQYDAGSLRVSMSPRLFAR
jgi:hypothetical protein